MASMFSKIGNSDGVRVFATVVAITVLGAGVAGAAITLAPDADQNPAMRPLTIGRSIQVTRAYGPDDEDCVFAVHKTPLPNGKTKNVRELVCAD